MPTSLFQMQLMWASVRNTQNKTSPKDGKNKTLKIKELRSEIIQHSIRSPSMKYKNRFRSFKKSCGYWKKKMLWLWGIKMRLPNTKKKVGITRTQYLSSSFSNPGSSHQSEQQSTPGNIFYQLSISLTSYYKNKINPTHSVYLHHFYYQKIRPEL